MGIIRTLNGDISAHQLGVTYSHDHIYCIPPYWAERQDDDLLLDDPQASERELSDFREAGRRARRLAARPAADRGCCRQDHPPRRRKSTHKIK